MINIEGVKCPICKERLTGSSTDELNRNLKGHMAELHQMRRISSSEQGGAYPSGTERPTEWSRQEASTTTWREPQYESREMSRGEGTMQGAMARPGEGMEPRGMKGARHGGGWGHRVWHRYDDMTMNMRCPICDSNIYASDEEDLSDEIRFHFKDAHRDAMRR